MRPCLKCSDYDDIRGRCERYDKYVNPDDTCDVADINRTALVDEQCGTCKYFGLTGIFGSGGYCKKYRTETQSRNGCHEHETGVSLDESKDDDSSSYTYFDKNDHSSSGDSNNFGCLILALIIIFSLLSDNLSNRTRNPVKKAHDMPKPVSQTVQLQQDISLLPGRYKGTYFAGQGEVGLTLSIYMDGEHPKASFKFYNLPGRTNSKEGEYLMDVKSEGGQFKFTAREWITRPQGYVFVDLSGSLAGDVLAGDAPTRFSVKRMEGLPRYGGEPTSENRETVSRTQRHNAVLEQQKQLAAERETSATKQVTTQPGVQTHSCTYSARISRHDKSNRNGARLTDPAMIVRQDRANYYEINRLKGRKNDADDENDPYFRDSGNRVELQEILQKQPGAISEQALRAIINGHPQICVNVFTAPGGKKISRVKVSLLEEAR